VIQIERLARKRRGRAEQRYHTHCGSKVLTGHVNALRRAIPCPDAISFARRTLELRREGAMLKWLDKSRLQQAKTAADGDFV
jgi:hypothetical protein